MTTITTITLACLMAASAAAQVASSSQHFLANAALGSGGRAQTSQFVLTATLGPNPAAERAFSAAYVLHGGFCAAVETVVAGRPWLTAVTPRFVTMKGAAPITVHGTELNLGTVVALAVGGVTATVQTRSNDAMSTNLPPQPAPGWQSVELTTTAGSAALARAVGVLPMIEATQPLQAGRRGELIYRGRQGDAMVWAYSLSLSPVQFRILPLLYGLELGFATLGTSGTIAVTDPSGLQRLPLPPLQAAVPIYVQAVTLSSDPGYSPGAFTNAIRLF